MYGRFDDITRTTEKVARDFVAARMDPVAHTGHILYGVFVSGASSQIPCFAAIVDGAAKVAEILAGGLPEGLLGVPNQGDGCRVVEL